MAIGTAAVLSVAGPVAAITDRGAITVAPWAQAGAVRAVVASVVSWFVAAELLRRRVLAVHLTRLALLAVLAATLASSAGRAQGLVVWTAAMAAHAALVRWEPWLGHPPRERIVAGSALPFVVAGQLWWVKTDALVPTLGLFVIALVVVEAAHLRPSLFRYEQVVDRAIRHVAHAASARIEGASTWRDCEVVVAAVTSAVLMGVVAYRYSSQPPSVTGSSDYANHLWYSDGSSIWPWRVAVPHPGFHQSVALLRSVLGRTWASTVVIAAASAAAGAILVNLARMGFGGRPPLPRRWGAGLAVGVIFADTPALIARALHVGNPWDWAPAARMVLSPTDMLQLPFALGTVLLIGRAISADRSKPAADLGSGPLLAAVTVAGSLVKPSLLLALIPGLAAYLVTSRRASGRILNHLARWLLAPAAAVLGWQIWFLTSGPGNFAESRIVVAPLATIRQISLDRVGPLLVSHLLVVPLSVWIDRRRYRGEPAIALLLWSLLSAFCLMFILDEQGPRGNDGNFAKPAFIVASLLFVLSWRFVLGHAVAAWRPPARQRRPLWLVPAIVLGAACLVAGTLGYLEAAGLLSLPPRGVPT